jgi:16S rRNA (guanine966-N2)-methyltransferase
LRVVAGEAGGLRLAAPAGTATRPTSDRVREAVFNALDSLGAVEDAAVLDLFAGSGALGIDALSRGATTATFVDADRAAVRSIEDNLAHTGMADRARVVRGDALDFLAGAGPVDLILVDPPYQRSDWDDLLTAALGPLSAGGVIVAESDREVDAPAGAHTTRVRRYGGTVVTFLRPLAGDGNSTGAAT